MHSDGYYFGTTLARRVDYFAFPRTGSHFLWTCFTGMFDLVFFPNQFVENQEARQRSEELNPLLMYAMKLREDGVPVQPVYIDAAPNGVHGGPVAGKNPTIILIRDPHPTIYSWYHTATERWSANIGDVREWMRDGYARYAAFYDAALAALAAQPTQVLLVRFEELRADPSTLAGIARFVGVRPKLSAEFVHEWTRFERMTRPGGRSFYRVGNNSHWQGDAAWIEHVKAVAPGDLSRFGYRNPW